MTRAEFEWNKNIINERLNILDVAKWLGLEVRGDRAPCPFHEENTYGAFQFNIKKGFCHCHSCGESADIIGLVEKVRGITAVDAIMELSKFFNLQLVFNNERNSLASKQAQNEYDKILARKQLLKTQTCALKSILNELKLWKILYAPTLADTQWDKRYTFSLKEYDVVEAYLTGLKEDNAPNDMVKQINSWQKIMYKIDPLFIERKKIYARLENIYIDFISGIINMDALLKKHKKVVAEYERITRAV